MPEKSNKFVRKVLQIDKRVSPKIQKALKRTADLGEGFARKVLDLDRPLTMKERATGRMAADEQYVKIVDQFPKDFVMSEEMFKRYQQTKRRIELNKPALDKLNKMGFK